MARITGHDKQKIKDAYLQLMRGDTASGMKEILGVILGWVPPEPQEMNDVDA